MNAAFDSSSTLISMQGQGFKHAGGSSIAQGRAARGTVNQTGKNSRNMEAIVSEVL
jgi:hypothetical protein